MSYQTNINIPILVQIIIIPTIVQIILFRTLLFYNTVTLKWLEFAYVPFRGTTIVSNILIKE